MKREQEQIIQTSGRIGAGLKEEKGKMFHAAAGQVLNKGKTAKETLGLTDAMVEGIYGQAYRLYNTGKYKEAIQIFRLLIMISPVESKYTMGIAACFHMLKQYKDAAKAYMVVGVIDPETPIPFYHLSDCYIQIGDYTSALIALTNAVERSGDKPEFRVLKGRALLSIDGLKKELGKVKPM